MFFDPSIYFQWQEYRAINLKLLEEDPVVELTSSNEIVQKMQLLTEDQNKVDAIRAKLGLSYFILKNEITYLFTLIMTILIS